MTSPRLLLASGTTLALLLGTPAVAQDIGADRGAACALAGGALPPGCASADAGDVHAAPVAANLEDEDGTGPLGDLGFSISIDPVAPAAPREVAAGDPLALDPTRDVDRLLDAAGVAVSFDGLGAARVLDVSTADLRRTFRAGEAVAFRASSNYPAWIARAEVRLTDRRTGALVAAVPIAPNGEAAWAMPATGTAGLDYALRAYDAAGRWDETLPLPIDRVDGPLDPAALDGPVAAAGEAQGRLGRQGIPVRGGAVTVSGSDLPPGTTITVMGEPVPVAAGGAFVLSRILPPGEHDVRVGVSAQGRTRSLDRDVVVPAATWFRTGLVDVTLGRDLEGGGGEDGFGYGRIAGYAEGRLADGTAVTARIDTEERDFEDWGDVLGELGGKAPQDLLRDVEPGDVFATLGDDSVVEDLAPASGGAFARIERDGSFVMWGDLRAAGRDDALVRTERTLYGLSAEAVTPAVTAGGEPRLRVSGFAAQPDTLLQRDRFRGTGGSTYFLSRRDIDAGTETVQVERRDPDTGRVIDVQTLAVGRDYRIDYIQGIVILNAPLASSAGDGGLVTDRPLGELDLYLVAQYEHEPALGDVDGLAAGARVEGWVLPGLRVGAAGIADATGPEASELLGLDLLLRRSEATWLSVEAARSEGPVAATTTSDNGGLDLDREALAADGGDALRVEGSLDLAEMGLAGLATGYLEGREEGFSSPDHPEVGSDLRSWGVAVATPLSDRVALGFALDHLEEDDGGRRENARAGVGVALSERLLLEAEVSRTDRAGPLDEEPDEIGARTDAGARLTYAVAPDLSAWAFGQATLDRSGPIRANDRLGLGAALRLSDALTLSGEASGGDLGPAAEAALAFSPSAGTTYSLGYRLDPRRAREADALLGTDRGTLVTGVSRAVGDAWTYTAENTFAAFGDQPSSATTFGAAYTPTERWRLDGGLELGETVGDDGARTDRAALSLGARFADAEALRAGLRTEWRRETSDEDGVDADTLAVLGFVDRRVSDDWRALANLDVVVSADDEASVRDGRYVEARLGWAYRPVADTGTTALLSYTYLEDLPGPDQVNVDGELDGPLQRSHIVNAALSRELSTRWTLGAKYGLRLREAAPREDADAAVLSTAHLGVLRLDYRVLRNWDLMAEGRVLRAVEAEATDYGALLGAYRHLGANLRLGGGYAWGGVASDLRRVEGDRQGIFVNLVAAF